MFIPIKGLFITIFLSLAGGLFSFVAPIEKLSLHLESKTLKERKVVTSKSDVFYKKAGGVMVTHFTSPFEFLVFTNAKGEIKMYDPKENAVSQAANIEMSSENSFLHQFLNGNSQDLGLKSQGFKVKGTHLNEGMVVTEFVPVEASNKISRVELVHEKYKPVFMGMFDLKGKALQKVYYSNYTQVDAYMLPLTITEITYGYQKDKTDSVIVKKVYSDLKVNGAVDDSYLNYKIPSNAKVVK
jgi:outer membrane lipoprotein-sorting protein